MHLSARGLRTLVSTCIAAVALAGPAFAQTYPAKTVKIIVGFAPGGPADVIARIYADKLGNQWGQAVVVDNRAGAGGNIGSEVTAKATPDGYTLLMVTAGTHGINPSLYRKLGFDAIKDFAPVSLVAMVPNIFVVNNAVPVKDLKEFIAYAKANQGKLNYGSPGNGSTAHLSMELFKSMTGIQIVHIPYKGSAGVLADLIGGQIVATMDNMPPYVPQVKAGKIRALAVTPTKRSSAVPELPTVAEAGVPGYDSGAWFGLVAPANTPKEIVNKLSRETARILKLSDVSARLLELGAEPVGGTPEQFSTHIKAEIAKWANVIKDANVELQ